MQGIVVRLPEVPFVIIACAIRCCPCAVVGYRTICIVNYNPSGSGHFDLKDYGSLLLGKVGLRKKK